MRIGDKAFRVWHENINGKIKTHCYWESDCENCPFSWEDRSYEGECNDYGCYYDRDSELSAPTIICLLPHWVKEWIKKRKGWDE